MSGTNKIKIMTYTEYMATPPNFLDGQVIYIKDRDYYFSDRQPTGSLLYRALVKDDTYELYQYNEDKPGKIDIFIDNDLGALTNKNSTKIGFYIINKADIGSTDGLLYFYNGSAFSSVGGGGGSGTTYWYSYLHRGVYAATSYSGILNADATQKVGSVVVDLVSYGTPSKTYYCKKNASPSQNPTNSEYWGVFADDGLSLEYKWGEGGNNFKLGVRRQGESSYTYSPRLDLEYQWEGTTLKVKKGSDMDYPDGVDLIGPVGPQGPAGEGVKYVHRGIWSAGVTYLNTSEEEGVDRKVELVYNNIDESTYYCKITHTSSNDPSNAPPNSTFWGLYAARGATGPIGPKGISFRFRGAYASGTEYFTDSVYIDTVSYDGSLYARTGPNQMVYDVPPTNTTHWEKIVSKGDEGVQGSTGATGTKILYQGLYSPSKAYYNNSIQTDCVSYSHNAGPTQLYIRRGEGTTQNNSPYDSPQYWSLAAQSGGRGPGWEYRGQWQIGEAYTRGVDNYLSCVFKDNKIYAARRNHTSTLLDAPPDPLTWELVFENIHPKAVGNWSPSVTYEIDEYIPVVYYDNMAWILSSGPSLNEVPGVSANWTAFSSTGPQGAQGPKGDKGEKGDTGNQGIQGIAGATFGFLGEWVSGETYTRTTTTIPVVWYNNQNYWLKVESTSSTSNPSENTTDWAILAQRGVQGEKGERGEKGDIGKGYNFLGNWVAGTAYKQDDFEIDVVFYGGNSYACLNATMTDVNTPPDTNTIDWGVFAEKGQDGQDGSQGLQGIQGKGFTIRGEWDSETNYANNSTNIDVVYYLGSSYACLQTNTGAAPIINPSYWQIIASKGDKGEKGDDGLDGADGVDGVDGAPGTNGTDGKSLRYRGYWDEDTEYINTDLIMDIVTYEGSSYICSAPSSIGSQPPNYPWSIIAQRGGVGAPGPTGLQGPSLRYIHKGQWEPYTSYRNEESGQLSEDLIVDLVYYEGRTWYCLQNHMAGEYFDSYYWEIFADSGLPGQEGPPGPQGEQGVPGDGAGNIYIDNINNLNEFYTGDKVAIQLTHIPENFVSEDRNIPLAYSVMNWSEDYWNDGVDNLYTYTYNQSTLIPSTLNEPFQAEILLNGNVYTAIFKRLEGHFQWENAPNDVFFILENDATGNHAPLEENGILIIQSYGNATICITSTIQITELEFISISAYNQLVKGNLIAAEGLGGNIETVDFLPEYPDMSQVYLYNNNYYRRKTSEWEEPEPIGDIPPPYNIITNNDWEKIVQSFGEESMVFFIRNNTTLMPYPRTHQDGLMVEMRLSLWETTKLIGLYEGEMFEGFYTIALSDQNGNVLYLIQDAQIDLTSFEVNSAPGQSCILFMPIDQTIEDFEIVSFERGYEQVDFINTNDKLSYKQGRYLNTMLDMDIIYFYRGQDPKEVTFELDLGDSILYLPWFLLPVILNMDINISQEGTIPFSALSGSIQDLDFYIYKTGAEIPFISFSQHWDETDPENPIQTDGQEVYYQSIKGSDFYTISYILKSDGTISNIKIKKFVEQASDVAFIPDYDATTNPEGVQSEDVQEAIIELNEKIKIILTELGL